MSNILNISEHGPFGGMTDAELKQLMNELSAEPEYRRKQLAALLIQSTLNINQSSLDEMGTILMELPQHDPEAYPEG
tara:strand:+ start:849 stop:1079 length:231 start_codon:yes stop_codon:yes gene_type:complete